MVTFIRVSLKITVGKAVAAVQKRMFVYRSAWVFVCDVVPTRSDVSIYRKYPLCIAWMEWIWKAVHQLRVLARSRRVEISRQLFACIVPIFLNEATQLPRHFPTVIFAWLAPVTFDPRTGHASQRDDAVSYAGGVLAVASCCDWLCIAWCRWKNIPASDNSVNRSRDMIYDGVAFNYRDLLFWRRS